MQKLLNKPSTVAGIQERTLMFAARQDTITEIVTTIPAIKGKPNAASAGIFVNCTAAYQAITTPNTLHIATFFAASSLPPKAK